MRAFVLKEPGVVGYVDVPEPRLTPYGAILRPVAVAPCSSDVHTVFGGGSRKAPNLVLGHECVAEVLEVGELVEEFRPGEIVAVPAITPNWRDRGIQERNFKHASAPFSGHQLGRSQPGVFAEKFLIPDADTTLAKIPASLSLEQALMYGGSHGNRSHRSYGSGWCGTFRSGTDSGGGKPSGLCGMCL